MNLDFEPNIDGDDYERDGKYGKYRKLLLHFRKDRYLPEDIKHRRLETLKTVLIPFWHRCQDLHDRESEELMAIYLKYNGPDGIRKHYSQELDEIKARIAGADDGALLKDMESFDPDPTRGSRVFHYGHLGKIFYEINQEKLRLGQERVQESRSSPSKAASSTAQPAEKPPVEVEGQLDSESRKRPREEEEEDAAGDDLNRAPKRRPSVRSPTPGPSKSSPAPRRRAASKRLRTHTDDDADNEDAERDQGQGPTASKRQRHDNAATPSGTPASSSGAAGPTSYPDPPPRASPKRARTPADDDSEGDDVEAGNGRGPSGSKRRRLTKDAQSASIRNPSLQAGPSTPRRATPDPGDMEPGSVQSHVTSLAGQATPQPVRFPTNYQTPSSKFLKFSRNSITMSKITKMGKKRPWLFSYKTAEGYGIYAFVKCPGGNCKHHFSRHPLRENCAQDHILACGQQIRDTRDTVRQYARQVVKDDDRKSDLTIDWARKSNLHLLPADQRDNHPENFPLSPDDE